jgi:tRNA threonylcarbamoyl adenosine modification protein YeaZ
VRVLALDTATEACSVALLAGDDLIGRYEEPGRGHAAQILGMVDAVLAEAGVTLSMLDGIAASVGPGAFTGVRISVAVAQGLAFGAGLAVAAVTTPWSVSMHAWARCIGAALPLTTRAACARRLPRKSALRRRCACTRPELVQVIIAESAADSRPTRCWPIFLV